MKLSFLPKERIDTRKKFLVKIAGSISLLSEFYEFSEEYNIDLKIDTINDNTKRLFFKVNLVNRISTNESFNYRFALLDLLTELDIQIDKKGEISIVYNKIEFEDLWVERRYDLKQKHKKEENITEQLEIIDTILSDDNKLVHFISQNGPFPLFFYPTLEIAQLFENSILLKDFLIKFDLPVIREQKKGKKNELLLTGKVDNEEFDKNSFIQFLKDKTDVYNLKVLLDLDFEEIYEYDTNGILEKAEHFIAAGVSGCFSNTVARTAILIDNSDG